MYLTTGTLFNNGLLDFIADMNSESKRVKVKEVYGSLLNDPIGTARESSRLPRVSVKGLIDHIEYAKESCNLDVVYALNSPAFLPTESNIKGVLTFLNLIKNCGVEKFIVSAPIIVELMEEHFPGLKVILSTILRVNSVRTYKLLAERYENIDRVVLDLMENRNFLLIKSLLSSGCDLELIVNEVCVQGCPWRNHHYIMQGTNTKYKDYPYNNCWAVQKKDFIAEILKARFICPEDLEVYRKTGVKWFKITGRTMPLEFQKRVIKAYVNEKHDGNLLDLFPIVPGRLEDEGEGYDYYIDSSKLAGFLEYFQDNGHFCNSACGVYCSYCDIFANKLRGVKKC